MEHVNFMQRFGALTSSGEWSFVKEYPSLLTNDLDGDLSEIWISQEKLKIPVGAKKVVVRFFVWLRYSKLDETFDCMFGMVPDKGSLDDKAVSVMNKFSGKKFFKNPYYHLLSNKLYRHVFLNQEGVSPNMVEDVKESMFLASDHVDANLLDYLYGNMTGMVKEDGVDDFENGWSVLTRARSGSLM